MMKLSERMRKRNAGLYDSHLYANEVAELEEEIRTLKLDNAQLRAALEVTRSESIIRPLVKIMLLTTKNLIEKIERLEKERENLISPDALRPFTYAVDSEGRQVSDDMER